MANAMPQQQSQWRPCFETSYTQVCQSCSNHSSLLRSEFVQQPKRTWCLLPSHVCPARKTEGSHCHCTQAGAPDLQNVEVWPRLRRHWPRAVREAVQRTGLEIFGTQSQRLWISTRLHSRANSSLGIYRETRPTHPTDPTC